MGNRYTKNIPEYIYFIEQGDGWFAGPYVKNPMKGIHANHDALITCKVERVTKLIEEEPLRARTEDELTEIGKMMFSKVYCNNPQYRQKAIDKSKIIERLANNQKEWLKHFEYKEILTEEEYEKIRKNYVINDIDIESLIYMAFDECNIILQKPDGSIDNTSEYRQTIRKTFERICGNKIHIICDETNNDNNTIDHKIAIANVYYFYSNHIISKELFFGNNQNILRYKTSLII